MPDDSLSGFVQRLTAALDGAGVPYMVVGSLASSLHGQPRSTQDVDFVCQMKREHVAMLGARLDPERYYFDEEMATDAVRRCSMFNIIDMASGWKADIIIPKWTRHARSEFPRRMQVAYGDVSLWCATPEDTLIAKLRWAKEGGSARQLEDASGIVRLQGNNLDAAYIAEWVLELELEQEWSEVKRQAGENPAL